MSLLRQRERIISYANFLPAAISVCAFQQRSPSARWMVYAFAEPDNKTTLGQTRHKNFPFGLFRGCRGWRHARIIRVRLDRAGAGRRSQLLRSTPWPSARLPTFEFATARCFCGRFCRIAGGSLAICNQCKDTAAWAACGRRCIGHGRPTAQPVLHGMNANHSIFYCLV